jgi:hypothetical protein
VGAICEWGNRWGNDNGRYCALEAKGPFVKRLAGREFRHSAPTPVCRG